MKTVLGRIEKENIAARIMRHDHTVWSPDPDEITNRLGWLDIADRLLPEAVNLQHFAKEIREAGFTQALLLGMGGSSLAPELFARTFGPHCAGLDVRVLDSTDPLMVLEAREWAERAKTLFIVSSKSGGTAETFSFFKYFYTWMKEKAGEQAASCFVTITDPGSGLEQISKSLNLRRTFINDPNIGGRFSALSLFGLVPAALTGVDLAALLTSARNADRETAVEIGAWMGFLALQGIDKLTFILSPELESFGDWAEQLIAESTGKKGKGILPVIGETVMPAAHYGKDRLFVHIRMNTDTKNDAAVRDLAAEGYPVLMLSLDHLEQLGEQFFIWELATAVAGHVLGINPFDQPNVESAKAAARDMISRYKNTGQLPEADSLPVDYGRIAEFTGNAGTGDYISVHAYIPMNPAAKEQMRQIQAALHKQTGLAVTTGFGPRFLHSTGQLHKGDRGNGLFIQLTCDADADAPIPNEPGNPASDMSFHVLKTAQAMGDFSALKNEKRRVIHFHLSRNVRKDLEILFHLVPV